jgi:hypothetical protein
VCRVRSNFKGHERAVELSGATKLEFQALADRGR